MVLAGLAVAAIANGLQRGSIGHDLWTDGTDVGGLFLNLMVPAISRRPCLRPSSRETKDGASERGTGQVPRSPPSLSGFSTLPSR